MTSPAHIIVFGNEKGGSGKSTTAMHVAVGLLRLGYSVGSIDLDARQGTLTRYMANRFEQAALTRQDIPSPVHFPIEKAKANLLTEQEKLDREFFLMALGELSRQVDFIVIDTPGSDTYLSRLAHSYADTVITPLNDSFIDLDVIARISTQTKSIVGPSVYTSMLREAASLKKGRGGQPPHWIVMRNRLSPHDASTKQEIGDLLARLAQEFNFDLAPGFGERPIFRDLFPKGLTLLDLKEDPNAPLTMSALAARQEVRLLLRVIDPAALRGYPGRKKSS